MSVFLAICALGLLVVVHESGHYFVAKWSKMRVERFSIGFGPALLKWKRNDTQFQLAPIPLGGFVQITGMNPHEDVDPDDPHIYPNRPTWQRFLTIAAGPAMNYVLGVVLIFCVLAIAGSPKPSEHMRVASVQEGMPAAGKLEPGDRILEVDGKPIKWQTQAEEGVGGHIQFKEAVQAAQGGPVTLKVLRAGQEVSVEITPKLQTIPGNDKPEYYVGIGPEPEVERVREGIGSAIVESAKYPVVLSKQIIVGLYQVVTRQVPAEATGPVGITHVIKRQIELGWVRAFEVMALLNVYLGLFNLLPLPALDGGRLAFLGYELATRRRPNPRVEAAVHMVGFVALLALMLLVTFKDIKRLF